ncbi:MULTISPECIES: hypothetical protein [unclassified Sphingomonas]|nr:MULTISPECIES: hypothetical protein [unclassified Sphingomonas]
MLAEFETHLADVLGSRLPAPLTGLVDRAPGRPEAHFVVTLGPAVPIADNLQSLRAERVPGHDSLRRVLRLRCEVNVTAVAPSAGRSAQFTALDTALFLLDDPAFRTGTALLPADSSDPGFLINSMLLMRVEPPELVALEVEGLFWPVGTSGKAGVPIATIALRTALQPLRLLPDKLPLATGGPAVDLTIVAPSGGGGLVTAAGLAPGEAPRLLVRVVDAGERPGSGTLGGGDAAAGGARRLILTGGQTTLSYTPPAAPGLDFLLVTLETPDGPGIELARFALATRPAT